MSTDKKKIHHNTQKKLEKYIRNIKINVTTFWL